MLIYTMVIIGLSMMPAIQPGLHNVSVADRDNLEIGKIYCYNPDWRCFEPLPGIRYVCHRLIDAEDDMLIFKGDNNERQDCPTEKRNVALKVLV